jgi:hypothetical protein
MARLTCDGEVAGRQAPRRVTMKRLAGPIAISLCLVATPAWGYLGTLQWYACAAAKEQPWWTMTRGAFEQSSGPRESCVSCIMSLKAT